MDEESSGGLVGLLVLLVLVAFVIQVIIQVITWIVQVTITVVAALILIATILAIFAILGLGTDLSLRILLGLWGDGTGMGKLPRGAQLALGVFWLAPWILIGDVSLVILVGWITGVWPGVLLSEVALAGLLVVTISMPVYYVAWWADGISGGRWRINLPFQTEATMRTEEGRLFGRVLYGLSQAQFRWDVFWRTRRGGKNG